MQENFWVLEIVHYPYKRDFSYFMEHISRDESLADYFTLFIEYDESDIPIYLYIGSDYINRNAKNKDDAIAKLHTLYFMLNGVYSLFYPNSTRIINTKIYNGYIPNKSIKSKYNYELKTENIKYIIPFDFNEEIVTINHNNLILSTINLAMNNEELFHILVQFGFEDSWVRLYCIWDSICSYLKKRTDHKDKKSIIKYLGLDNKTIKKFEYCANSYGLLFLESRHGELGHTLPTDVMEKECAIYLIKDIIRIYSDKIFKEFK